MSVRIKSFGGPLIWLLRKYKSNFTSKVMLSAASWYYSKNINQYIEWFLKQEKTPLFQNVMIETINRCNGECAFCPANKHDESRPFMKMPDEIYYDIIHQLKSINWHGKLFMCVNNEPFMDKRIIHLAKFAKEEIPDIKIAMISNGTLLTPEKLDDMIGVVDQLVVNAYGERYRLPESHKKIYDYIKNNSARFISMTVTINRRYSKELLATRAGNAPNKPKKNNRLDAPCIYPFTDMIIFPNGKVGMCCNDCKEVSCFGDIAIDPILTIWNNKKFRDLRLAMRNGRSNYSFCQECDVVDAGEREKQFRKNKKENK